MGLFDFLNSLNQEKKKDSDQNTSGFTNVLPFREEYSADLTTGANEDFSRMSVNSYSDMGVRLNEVVNSLRLTYTGLLAKNHAKDIYAVIGYGNNLQWEDVETCRMNKTGNDTFEAIFSVKRGGNINIAFKDDAENWDNNQGMNYTFVDQFNQSSH